MLVTFRSSATPDVRMLRELAQYLLGVAGKRLDTPGVIQHDELPGVISRLEIAISDEEKAEIAEDALNYIAQIDLREHASGVTQLVSPFLDMMRQADLQRADIVWGT